MKGIELGNNALKEIRQPLEMSDACIHWVVALRPEADPIIRQFNLKSVSVDRGNGDFPVWESSEGAEGRVRHRLVLCGIGKVNAAAATAWLQATQTNIDHAPSGWINFGIAGHREREIGEVTRANRVTDFATNRSWYPPATWKRKFDLPASPLRTVDAPSSIYPEEDCLLDMEASGVFSVASRFSSLELVQAIKVVSDNLFTSIESISKDSVKKACGSAVEEISPWLDAFIEIVRAEGERLKSPPLHDALIEKFRFSETQKHQLRRILIRHNALNAQIAMSDFDELKSGREVIAALHSLAN